MPHVSIDTTCALALRSAAASLSRSFTRVLLRFLQSLHDHGRAELAPGGRDLAAAVDAATADPATGPAVNRLLESWHRDAVPDLPGAPLAFHPAAAQWGAHLLFRAACLTAFRDLGESDIARWLKRDPMPDAASPAAHFSADLCLRHWADLYRMARARSEDDPLVKAMHDLAVTVPLAAPGMHHAPDPAHPVFRHAGLAQLFAERALEHSDTTCLALPEIHRLVRSKLGAYAAGLGRGLLPPALHSDSDSDP